MRFLWVSFLDFFNPTLTLMVYFILYIVYMFYLVDLNMIKCLATLLSMLFLSDECVI